MSVAAVEVILYGPLFLSLFGRVSQMCGYLNKTEKPFSLQDDEETDKTDNN